MLDSDDPRCRTLLGKTLQDRLEVVDAHETRRRHLETLEELACEMESSAVTTIADR